MEMQTSRTNVLLRGPAIVAYVALFNLLLHFYFGRYYGYQRDELYFIACGRHLAWGYVDVGPLTMWLGSLGHVLFGETLFGFRFFSFVAGAGTVLLTGLIARELGGGRYAQFLAALCVVVAPVWMIANNVLALPSFEPIFWAGCALLLIRVLKTGNSKLWLWFGVVAGIGLLNKFSMAFFGVATVIGLLLTPHRKQLLNKWLWIGGLIALAIVAPGLWWQFEKDWPTLQFIIGMNRGVMARIPRLVFVLGQVVYQNPATLPVWLAGLWFLLFSQAGKPYRIFGWVYAIIFLFMFIVKSKIYYLSPAYPMMLGAGAVAIADAFSKPGHMWARVAAVGVLVAGGAVMAPLGLPILPIDKLDGYVGTVTGGMLKNVYELTGTYHDQFGWKNQAESVAKVYHSLPPEDQASCMIIAGNFGQAGAIDFYGPALGLPPVTAGHQNYFFWARPEEDKRVAVAFGVDMEDPEMFFSDIQEAAVITCSEAVPSEQHVPVYVCREPKASLREVWPSLRALAFRN